MFPWGFSPFNQDMFKKLQKMKPQEIEKYVYDMMGKMFPPEMNGMNFGMTPPIMETSPPQNEESPPEIDARVFETHDDVFVIIPIKDKDSLKDIKIAHTSNQLIIRHMPDWEDKHTITLPAIVRKKGTKATYQDGTLEIRLQKNIDLQFSEIDINEKF
ncbi:Hsp20/alpha crystallin family protein [Robertmurraya andreesenii]|uniref:HSP20 family molecular chaperone IbpA n=1 Tax=Anoxybacillus andreesenii TaxID=1325932 RepID=A0ABT9V297_9BACL|nr:Hsp20/alpha crystallin family protein [Robertmurraya andreesenii]MDQ0155075.1 HSP20 family molecular chaperone IbpA [Robertmurraya andreesenii]